MNCQTVNRHDLFIYLFQLQEVKSGDKSQTFLHYLAHYIENNYPELMDFGQELDLCVEKGGEIFILCKSKSSLALCHSKSLSSWVTINPLLPYVTVNLPQIPGFPLTLVSLTQLMHKCICT